MTLDLDHATMQRLGRLVADHVATHLSTLRDQRLFKTIPRSQAEPLVYTPPPAKGESFEQLLGFLEERVFPHHTPEGRPHPRRSGEARPLLGPPAQPAAQLFQAPVPLGRSSAPGQPASPQRKVPLILQDL